MKAIIVGSGPSAQNFSPPPNITIISVKGSIKWLSRADYWFSLDPNENSRSCLKDPKPNTKYFMALQDKDPGIPNFVTILKRVALQPTKEPLDKNSPEWWLWRWSCVTTLNTNPGHINTGNSAWGALGLAYHLQCTNVLLVGVDGTQDERIEGGTPNNLSHLSLLFQSANNQIKLSTISNLKGIRKTTLEEWIHE